MSVITFIVLLHCLIVREEPQTIQPYRNFFGISKDSWRETVKSYKGIKKSKLSKYLQWYPLQNITFPDDYYEKVIRNGYFVFNKQIMDINDNYLQKANGSFRQAQLLSPTLYLVLESLCREIYKSVNHNFISDHALYSGEFDKNEVTYNKQYNLFYKEVNMLASIFTHYIKADLKDFFRYIDIDILFNKIENNSHGISPTHIYLYKRFFEYIGNGSFPIIENSTGLSYLATKIYLYDVDKTLKNFLVSKLGSVNFAMIRYVDDLYIFINGPSPDLDSLNEFYLDFKNFYQSKLREINLSLNVDKTSLNNSSNINDDLKKSFYGGTIYDEDTNIHEVEISTYIRFLDSLISNTPITISKYNNAVNEAFSIEEQESSDLEIYNYILYDLSDDFRNNDEIVAKLNKIINENIYSYDVKRIVLAILNTRDGNLIRKLLNKLFNTKEWHDAENYAAITYLLNRGFKHRDLMDKLNENLNEKSKKLHDYINVYCISNSYQSELLTDSKNFFNHFYEMNISITTSQLYFLHLVENNKENYFIAHSYFKSFFDRITAEILFHYWNEREDSISPNYRNYYKANKLKKVYQNIENSQKIIERAHKIRNSNPINHGEATLIKEAYSQDEVKKSIFDLRELIFSLIKNLENEVS